jgi:ETFB lysine methyltransferase
MKALSDTLGRRFRTVAADVTAGGRDFHIVRPESAESLIDEDAFAHDERLPYWAELWPSSLVLASHLPAPSHEGMRLLELGCGVGLVAAAAASLGWDVLATDYYEDALRFARVNVWRNCGVAPRTRLVDWRDLPSDLGEFDLIVAADVLYEQRYAEIIADVLAKTLRADTRAVIADPGRYSVPAFLTAASARGLSVRLIERVPFGEGAIRQTIDLREVSCSPARRAPPP